MVFIAGIKTLSRLYKIFPVSNCEKWYLRSFIEIAGTTENLSGSDCHGSSKTSKEEMLAKMKKTYSLANPVYVGDTIINKKAAAAVGMEFTHVAYGFGTIHAACLTFESFSALVNYFIVCAAHKPQIV